MTLSGPSVKVKLKHTTTTKTHREKVVRGLTDTSNYYGGHIGGKKKTLHSEWPASLL